jgi:trehalose 6-phosphate synthase
MPWTKKRLEEVARTRLDGAKLIVVANREPFIHVYDGEEIRLMKPASGLTTALDPVKGADFLAANIADRPRRAKMKEGLRG